MTENTRTVAAAAIPKVWLIPQADRAVLAIIATVFWAGTIWQAVHVQTHGASVFSLFGLGLIYMVFSLYNLDGAIGRALRHYETGQADDSQARSLMQLFAVLAGMLVCNLAVLVIYLAKGASFTKVDDFTIVIDAILLIALVARVGFKGLTRNPLARGWIAVAGKTVPQIVTALLFLFQPMAAHGLALITLLGIDALASLRLWPTVRAFLRDRRSRHLRGLLLGEAGNTMSGILLTITWAIAIVK
ncbi:MAG TPA: hypothetical protein VHT70_01130 [Candidatus Saccharimonadales bacterium]|jgi:hypothetical protein|nr:hypothetical protein [Candidatus Saccharimonadales bacterium]